MCKIKYCLLLRKNYPQIFLGSLGFQLSLNIFLLSPMNLNETKNDFDPENKKKLKKSKFEVLTNENDFLVKNLKKAGWSTWAFKYFSNNKLFKLPFKDKKMFSWMITYKILVY